MIGVRTLPFLVVLTLTAGCPQDGDDADGDGVPASRDCDDQDASVGEAQPEACDGIDNDCNGRIDDAGSGTTPLGATRWYRDVDEDGFGQAGPGLVACDPPEDGAWVDNDEDCDDLFDTVYPGAVEVCDLLDNDCNGTADDDPTDPQTFYRDSDEDGFGDEASSESSCEPSRGFVANSFDCDDADPDVNPNAVEICDSKDNNCNDEVDEATDASPLWYVDNDADGVGVDGANIRACTAPDGYAELDGDCDDADPARFPSNPELCDGIDNDCDEATTDDGLVALDGVTAATLSGAITAAKDGSTVHVCAGTWRINATVGVDLTLAGPQGADQTFLEPASDGPMLTLGSGTTVVVSSLTFREGAATTGGAIDGSATDFLSVQDCVFSDNLAEDGGAIAMGATSTLSLADTSFTDNLALGDGGAVLAGLVNIERTTFTGNAADRGGALAISGGDATLDVDTVLSTNEASTGGGGVAVLGAHQLNGGELDSNSTAGNGGGIWLANGAAALLSDVHDNDASESGGGIYCASGCTIESPLLDANLADRGGAIAVGGVGTATVTGASLTNNVATDIGGGVSVDGGGTMVLDACTLHTNDATTGGGAAVVSGGLESVSSDWGSSTTDNSPDDIDVDGTIYDDFGSAASFECSADSRSCE